MCLSPMQQGVYRQTAATSPDNWISVKTILNLSRLDLVRVCVMLFAEIETYVFGP